MPALGITGGVASGKSTLTTLLADFLHAEIFDSDRFVHELLQSSAETISEIVGRFGDKVIAGDGTVDRRKLGSIVFFDPVQRQHLERIVHPRVRQGWKEAMAAMDAPDRYLLIDIPLLFETAADRELPATVLVGCSREVQLNRMQHLRRIERDQAVRMVDAQMQMAEKVERATHVVWNDGSLPALQQQTSLLANFLISR